MVMQATLRQNFLHFLIGLVLLFFPIVLFLNNENNTTLDEAETHIKVTAASLSESYLSFSANEKVKKNQSNGTTTSSNPTRSSNQTVQLAAPPSNKNVLKGKTIVLDPGHGGKDDGTTSVSGIPEKTLTLETAELVAQKLSLAGAHVVLTRTNDTYISLDKRVNISEAQNADAFISLHYNASPIPFVKGISSYYYTKNKDQELAFDILDGVLSSTGLSSRGNRFDNLHVLRENTQPCTLIELGFVSNKSEDQAVETNRFRTEVADGIYIGLISYFSSK